jgi:hypothetical protein
MEECKVVGGAPIISCSQASEVLEFVEAPFDQVALSAELFIVRDEG